MLRSLVKWIAYGLLLLVLIAVIVLTVGARLSLDSERLHERRVAALPLYPAQNPRGEVRVQANGHEFRVRLAGCDKPGNSAKPAVILLHGFPVSSAMWLPLIEPLVRAGYCVVAPDQRGYSPGARPANISDYRVDYLSEDILAIADTLGIERFNLVGHDWGSVVGWVTVLRAPQRIISWTGLSIAHPSAFGEALATDPDQQARSRYFFLFTSPWLPETLLGFNNLKLLKAGYSGLPDAQVQEYVGMLAEPGALTAVLNWYRAMDLGEAAMEAASTNISAPSLFIWGNQDVSAGRRAVELQRDYMQGPYQEIELEAGHWLIREKPEQVIEAVLNHLLAFNNEER